MQTGATAVPGIAKDIANPVLPRSAGSDADTDGDGVTDELELNGYSYDRLTGKFVSKEMNAKAMHWFTDPLQWSTDQDAYSDGMEASGATMDVAIRAPGNDPLVPAYPNIVVELVSYAVTLNEDITYDEGGSLAKGTTWNRETTQTSSLAREKHVEVGVEAEWSAGVSFGAKGKASLTVGAGRTSTQTSSTAVSVGGSVLDETNWSRARSMNPTDAARIKLRVKVHNFGTACASNVFPTLTLRIGGINVATFEPGNAQINLLVPGGVYPPESGVYWVIDSIDTGVGITPLSLTMDELRALERGAPVSVSVTQLKADVMLADRTKGWSSAGDVNEYLARCEAVSANIHVEAADGSFAHYLVFADEGSSSPVTMEAALRRIGMRDDGAFPFRDSHGAVQWAPLTNHQFAFDQDTLDINHFATLPATPPAGLAIAGMVLRRGGSVTVRAPRASSDVGPTIHYANYDSRTRKFAACVSDYQGIREIVCIDNTGEAFLDDRQKPLAMIEDIAGSGFYQAAMSNPDYVFDGSEQVVVTNAAGQVAKQTIEVIYYEQPPKPEKPIITAAWVDWSVGETPRLYASVTNPNASSKYPLNWVRVVDRRLTDGFLDMKLSAESYKYPDRWEVNLKPVLAKALEAGEQLNVVACLKRDDAMTGLDYYSELSVPRALARLQARADWKGRNAWVISGMDFDFDPASGAAPVVQSPTLHEYPKPLPAPIDITVSSHESNLMLRFNHPYAYLPGAEEEFEMLSPEKIDELLSSKSKTSKPHVISQDEITKMLLRKRIPAAFGKAITADVEIPPFFRDILQEKGPYIFVLKTDREKRVKMLVDLLSHEQQTKYKRNAIFEVSYVVYDAAAAPETEPATPASPDDAKSAPDSP